MSGNLIKARPQKLVHSNFRLDWLDKKIINSPFNQPILQMLSGPASSATETVLPPYKLSHTQKSLQKKMEKFTEIVQPAVTAKSATIPVIQNIRPIAKVETMEEAPLSVLVSTYMGNSIIISVCK